MIKQSNKSLKRNEFIKELAPNEKTRKEAEKLIETVENGSTSLKNKNKKQSKLYWMKQKVL